MKKVYDKKSNQHNTRSILSKTINENRSDGKHLPISIFDNDTLGNTSNEKFDKIAMKLE
jgi:polyhydroxyalkanoate synthesis regulator protein